MLGVKLCILTDSERSANFVFSIDLYNFYFLFFVYISSLYKSRQKSVKRMLAKYLHFISFFPQQGRLIFFIHPEPYFIILLLIECNLVRRKYCPKALVR